MSINLNFGNYNNYSMSESRVSMMMQEDRKSATSMNLWERFKDLFRTDKKSDAYNELYNIVHDTEGGDKLDIFNKLKSCAKSEHQHLFRKEIFCDDVVFFIGSERISETPIQKLINISDQAPLCSMSVPEKDLFLEMLDSLREKESQSDDRKLSHIRKRASYEHRYDLLGLYRPQEDLNMEGKEWKMAESLTASEIESLKCLNAGNMTSFSQFYLMGYQKNGSDVEFTMVHPLISFLQRVYIRDSEDYPSFKENNSHLLCALNEGYETYHRNKSEVDTILKRVYDEHGETLNISHLGQNRNKLISPVAVEYTMQGSSFTDELNESLSVIFDKWTDPNLHLSENLWFAVHDTNF